MAQLALVVSLLAWEIEHVTVVVIADGDMSLSSIASKLCKGLKECVR